MSWFVKVHGETLPELKLALEAKLNELNGREGGARNFSVVTKEVKVVEPVETDEEMVEVESPYKATPSLPATKVHAPVVINDSSEVDKDGVVWDARIHASSRNKNADGSWRCKRNLHEDYYNHVMSELLANKPVVTPVVQQTPVVEAAPEQQATAAALPTMQMSQNGHSLETFKQQFPMVLTALINAGKINQDYINQLKAFFQVSEIWMINDEQKAQLFENFVQYGFVQKVG